MNPIPAVLMQAVIVSGGISILTPSAVSTSAEPDCDDRARLPCFATGTPAPATMKAAHVEMLNEPDASPPVPTTSIALSGASTVSILARMAVTAAVICDGVTSPDIILSNASYAISRDRVAPEATCPISALISTICPARLIYAGIVGKLCNFSALRARAPADEIARGVLYLSPLAGRGRPPSAGVTGFPASRLGLSAR